MEDYKQLNFWPGIALSRKGLYRDRFDIPHNKIISAEIEFYMTKIRKRYAGWSKAMVSESLIPLRIGS